MPREVKIENTPEFAEIHGQKKMWCPECRKRTLHELDPGDPERPLQSSMAPGWWCMDCGLTTLQK